MAPAKQRRFVIQKHDATPAALRSPAGIRRRLQVLGGDARAPRSIRTTSGLRSRSRIIRSTTAISKAPFPKGQYGGGTVMLWDRGYWESRGSRARLQEGRSQVQLDGEQAARQLGAGADAQRPHGGKRTNWLLIKHRDEYRARKVPTISWKRIKSVASGRSMEQIAAGKGRAPKPFMLRRTDAQGRMRSGSPTAARPPRRAQGPRRRRQGARDGNDGASQERSRQCRISSRRSSAASVERPPSGDGWVP